MENKVELLAPAGDLEKLKIALKYGADAVYIGGSLFSLRANATNFSIDEIKEGVEYAHSLNKKVYVTVNISLHNKEVELLKDYLINLDKIGVDAIIVSDPAVIVVAKENTSLQIHLSTQQSTLNKEAVSYFKEKGVSRIVLARECTLEEIKEIKNSVDIELETFIHGAMCASYSGRCVLSNYFTSRDSNRGGCAQICRWNFDLLDENKRILKGEKDFTFCTKDLSMLKYIPSMIDSGITSFKIEGRMRSSYYIATIVNIYRKVIDEYYNNKDNFEYNINYENILRRCANRDSLPQFIDGNYGKMCQYYNGREEISNQDFLGIVIDYDNECKMATIEERNYIKKGDIAEIFGPNTNIDYKFNEIYDEDNNIIEFVNHPKEIFKIYVDTPVYKDDMIRIKNDIDK